MRYDALEVGTKIRNMREDMGLSITEFSNQIGFSESHLRMIELGHRKMSLDIVLDLANFFGTDANHILGMEAKADYSVDALLQELTAEQRSYIVNVVKSMVANVSLVA